MPIGGPQGSPGEPQKKKENPKFANFVYQNGTRFVYQNGTHFVYQNGSRFASVRAGSHERESCTILVHKIGTILVHKSCTILVHKICKFHCFFYFLGLARRAQGASNGHSNRPPIWLPLGLQFRLRLDAPMDTQM